MTKKSFGWVTLASFYAAQQSLLIVRFAAYTIPAIAAAIVRAAKRDVLIRTCEEALETTGQKMAHDTIKALGAEVALRAIVFHGVLLPGLL